jgi:hypothetical protein
MRILRIWQYNAKMRAWLDRIGWPLVTRKRYQLLKDNMGAEIDHGDQTVTTLQAALAEAREGWRNCKKEVAALKGQQ